MSAPDEQPMTWPDLEYGHHAAPVPEVDEYGNCGLCHEHPNIHVRRGRIVPPREFHAADEPAATEITGEITQP